jgi:inorganic pyrophosphatase
MFAEFHDLWRVPPHFLREVEHFFATYKELEGVKGEITVETLGWEGPDKAHAEALASIERYKAAHPETKFGRRSGDKKKPARKPRKL